jgi:hypothetical protein
MWRPKDLGTVIAERALLFKRRGKPSKTVRLKFGQPVRRRGGPWWCPVQIAGLGPKKLIPIAGEDSLQALVLALEFVTLTLPAHAKQAGGYLDWLGERGSPVFSGTINTVAVVDGIRTAIDYLHSHITDRGRQQLLRRLKTIARTWGVPRRPRSKA